MKDMYFVSQNYVDKQKSSIIYLTFTTIDELTQLTKDYYGKSLILSPEQNININGVTIPAWTKMFLPFANGHGDMMGIALYPDASVCYSIGHTSGCWFARQIY